MSLKLCFSDLKKNEYIQYTTAFMNKASFQKKNLLEFGKESIPELLQGVHGGLGDISVF